METAMLALCAGLTLLLLYLLDRPSGPPGIGSGIGMAMCMCVISCTNAAELAAPVTRDGRTFVYNDHVNPALERAEREARAMWAAVGADPPPVPVFLGEPPVTTDGMCYGCLTHDQAPVIVVRYPRTDLVAHEMGHAMGLYHVKAPGEIMNPSVKLGDTIGPATLAELARVRSAGLSPSPASAAGSSGRDHLTCDLTCGVDHEFPRRHAHASGGR